jgi:hypothetical protein
MCGIWPYEKSKRYIFSRLFLSTIILILFIGQVRRFYYLL